MNDFERERLWDHVDRNNEKLDEHKQYVEERLDNTCKKIDKIDTYITTKEKQTTKIISVLGGVAAIIAIIGVIF